MERVPEGLISVQIDDLLLTVDLETAVKLENDEKFRFQYVTAVKQQLLAEDPPTAPKDSSKNVWTSSKSQTVHDQEATTFFLELRKIYKQEFGDKTTNKNSIWSKIASEMNEKHFYVGEGMEGQEKCRQKFANLQAAYLKYIDKRRQTGEGKIIKPPYFDYMSEILGDKHKCEPKLIIDSLGKVTTSSVNCNIQSTAQEPLPSTSSSIFSNISSGNLSSSSKEKSTQNRFSVKDTVRPDKNKLLEQYVNITKQNMENNNQKFSEIMKFMREESSKRHEEMLAVIKTLVPSRKRKRSHKDDNDDDASD